MNWLAIIIAAIANMVIGFLWYGSWAFGKSWVSLSGRDMGGSLSPGPTYGLTIVASLVQAIAMSWFVAETGATNGSAGALVGLFAGLGFVATAMFAQVMFAGTHPRLFAITAGYAILALIVQGAIIGLMGGA